MKSINTVILHKSKWDSSRFFNFVLTGARSMFAYSMYKLLGTIQFRKGKKSFWKDECSTSTKDFREYLKESYANSKGVLPYK